MRIAIVSVLSAILAGPALAGPQSLLALGPLPADAVQQGRMALQAAEAAPDTILQLGLAGPRAGCGKEALAHRGRYLAGLPAPTLVTAGAGDRMACAMARGAPQRPLEAHRLAFHDAPQLTAGRTPGVAWTEAAAGRPENRALLRGAVLHLVASDGDPEAAADWIRAAAHRARAAGATAAVVGLPSDPFAPGRDPVAAALAEVQAQFSGRLLALHPGAAPMARGPGGVMVSGLPRDDRGAALPILVDPAAAFPFRVPDGPREKRVQIEFPPRAGRG